MLRSTSVEKRLVNGVRGSLKNTDGEWATWTKNDSIALTFDAGVRKRMGNVTLGCLNDFGWAIHKPRKVEVWLSDNDMHYQKVAEKRFVQDEIFREGRFVDDISLDFEGRTICSDRSEWSGQVLGTSRPPGYGSANLFG